MEWLIYTLIYAVLMGFTTKIIINNKGYDDNWFWWGFWFGVFAVVVACAKPQNIKYTQSNSQPSGFYNYNASGNYTKESERIRNRDTLNAGGWQCPCGRVNASYVSTCTCGRNKTDVKSMAYKKEEQEKKEAEIKKQEAAKKEAEVMDESAKVSAIKGYKELLDSGIITQEEFEAKKKQLLGL